jgi:hypothetical protein
MGDFPRITVLQPRRSGETRDFGDPKAATRHIWHIGSIDFNAKPNVRKGSNLAVPVRGLEGRRAPAVRDPCQHRAQLGGKRSFTAVLRDDRLALKTAVRVTARLGPSGLNMPITYG